MRPDRNGNVLRALPVTFCRVGELMEPQSVRLRRDSDGGSGSGSGSDEAREVGVSSFGAGVHMYSRKRWSAERTSERWTALRDVGARHASIERPRSGRDAAQTVDTFPPMRAQGAARSRLFCPSRAQRRDHLPTAPLRSAGSRIPTAADPGTPPSAHRSSSRKRRLRSSRIDDARADAPPIITILHSRQRSVDSPIFYDRFCRGLTLDAHSVGRYPPEK